MKHMLLALCLLCAGVIPLSTCWPQGAGGGLLAKQYPGSVVDPNRSLEGAPSKAVRDARSSEFYSKDPVEKVQGFYKTAGEFRLSSEGDYILVWDVVPFGQVVGIVEKKGGSVGEGGNDFWGGTMAGVTVHGKPTNGSFHYSVTKVFDALEKAYLLRFQDPDNFDPASIAKHLEDPELKSVKAKYEHLGGAYYMESNINRKDGYSGVLSMLEVIYDQFYTDPAAARAKELQEVQKQYNNAITKMQYDEATKLGDRMMKLSGIQPDHQADWNTAIKCLEEMDKHAYRTKIVIDTHPSRWMIVVSK
jgi:hypothetical protein